MPTWSTSFLLIFNDFDLVQLQIHRSLSAEHGDDHTHAVFVRLQLVHNAKEAGQPAKAATEPAEKDSKKTSKDSKQPAKANEKPAAKASEATAKENKQPSKAATSATPKADKKSVRQTK